MRQPSDLFADGIDRVALMKRGDETIQKHSLSEMFFTGRPEEPGYNVFWKVGRVEKQHKLEPWLRKPLARPVADATSHFTAYLKYRSEKYQLIIIIVVIIIIIIITIIINK